MKRNPDEDYKDITEIAEALGFRKATQPGFFFYPNCTIQIDMTASGKNERDILTNALRQVIEFKNRNIVREKALEIQPGLFRNGK